MFLKVTINTCVSYKVKAALQHSVELCTPESAGLAPSASFFTKYLRLEMSTIFHTLAGFRRSTVYTFPSQVSQGNKSAAGQTNWNVHTGKVNRGWKEDRGPLGKLSVEHQVDILQGSKQLCYEEDNWTGIYNPNLQFNKQWIA